MSQNIYYVIEEFSSYFSDNIIKFQKYNLKSLFRVYALDPSLENLSYTYKVQNKLLCRLAKR